MPFTFIPNGRDVLLCSLCRPTVLNVSLSGDFRPERVIGRFLHLKYVITDQENEAIRPGISGLGVTPDGAMEVEFDCAGELQLNWPGSVYLTGGDPNSEHTLSVYRRNAPFEKTWHPLTTHVPADTEIPIPAHHTRISAHETVLASINGQLGELDHVPIRCVSARISLAEDTSIITEWYG